MANENNNEPQVVVKGLKKHYLDGKVQALRGAELAIRKGEFVIIYGPSGCGKSTLLGLIAALDKPTSGAIYVEGHNINRLDPRNAALYRRHEVGMVFQQFNLVSTLTALDNVALPLILSGINKNIANKRARHILEILGLGDRAKHKPSQLSGGEQQRVAISRALALNPSILLVDEPTGNLDEQNSNEVIKTLQEINAWGRTVVMVTHNPDYAKYADRILEMHDGVIKNEKTVRSAERRPQTEILNKIKDFVPDKIDGMISNWSVMSLSWAHLRSNKLRTFFAAMGVALGIGAIVGLVSLGIGLQRVTAEQIASFNALVTVEVSKTDTSPSPFDDATVQKLSEIEKAELVSPSIIMAGDLTIDETSTSVIASGINEEALDFEEVEIISGDYSDIVITEGAARNFGVQNYDELLGKELSLALMEETSDNPSLEEIIASAEGPVITGKVSGIVDDELVSAVYFSLDEMKLATGAEEYTAIKVKADGRNSISDVRKEVEAMGFTTKSVTDLMERINSVFLIVQIILGTIGGLALIVALLGIVNIMTISLIERTHEVGIMKAIGASNKEIGRMFASEAGILGLIGGLSGVVVAATIGWGINGLLAWLMKMSEQGQGLALFYTPWYLLVAMVVLSYLVARLAGWYPSRRAAKLSAMEALRYE